VHDVPAELVNRNVIVQVVTNFKTEQLQYFYTPMRVTINDNYG
jgi:hypothetical protein